MMFNLPSVAPYPYVRHRPELSLLYQVIDYHLPKFYDQLDQHNRSVPKFVKTEFADSLKCGRLEHGFIRVKCTDCQNELLVAFSCKRRGFCPSCTGRRMVESSHHLVTNVLPHVPVRQWVLSFPWPLRMLYANHPAALTRSLAIVVRAIDAALLRKAGIQRKQGARTGAVTFIQRFGSALNPNIHFHLLISDGIYQYKFGKVRFHRLPAPKQIELESLLDQIVLRITRQLERTGLLVQDQGQPYLDLDMDTTLEQFASSSIQYRVLIGPNAGTRTLTIGLTRMPISPRPAKPLTANRDGFSLNAAVSCQPLQRDKLERLCRL
ncbi:MAG: transposase [Gammaproteobacteria bacterium]|nr:transposase [Gammaproteobacteria bacterium]